MRITYSCENCKATVTKTRTPGNMKRPPRFCSKACQGKAVAGTGKGNRPNTFYQCAQCGKEMAVYRSPSNVKETPAKYCSLKCIGKAHERENNPAWNGGRYKTGQGYIVVFSPDHPHASVRKTVFEHRLVMEQVIGRYLKPEEVVHHKNGIKDDNRPENLELLPSQGAHSKLHGKLRAKK